LFRGKTDDPQKDRRVDGKARPTMTVIPTHGTQSKHTHRQAGNCGARLALLAVHANILTK
jgi:hypothetical protein